VGWRAAGLPLLPYTPVAEPGTRPIRPLPNPDQDPAGHDGLLAPGRGKIELVG
jgi:hypothetical protein